MYGSDRMAIETTKALRDMGHEVDVVLPNDGVLKAALEVERLRVSIVPMPVLRKSILRPGPLVSFAGKSVFHIARSLRSPLLKNADIVFVNTIVQPHWLLLGRLLNKKVLCHVREAEDSFGRVKSAILHSPLSLADILVCNSKSTLNVLKKTMVTKIRSSAVVYNGKSWKSYLGIQGRSRASKSPELLLVGRLSPRKGQDLAIRALAELHDRGYDASLVLAGDSFTGYEWFEDELRALVAQSNLEEKVRFLGFVDDPSRLYESADVALVPSRVEPFGTVAVEAMASGTPVVVSGVQGLGEIVSDGVNGLIAGSEDAKLWADAVQKLLDDSTAYSSLSTQGRRDAQERFSADAYRQHIQEVVQAATSARLEPAR